VSWVKGIIIQDLNGIYPFLLEGAPKQRLGGAVDHHEKIGNPNPPVDGYPIFFCAELVPVWKGDSLRLAALLMLIWFEVGSVSRAFG